MQIFVRGLNGGTSTLVTSPDDTILDLMSKIHEHRGEHAGSLMYKEDSTPIYAFINPSHNCIPDAVEKMRLVAEAAVLPTLKTGQIDDIYEH